MLMEILFCEEYRISCGIKAYKRGLNRVVFRCETWCRKPNPIYRQFALEQEPPEED